MKKCNIDLNEIDKAFNKVLEYAESYNIPELKGVPFHTKQIIEKWYKQKKRFLEQWGGPIYECDEITLTLEPKIKANKVFSFAERVQNYFLNNELSDFIFTNKNNFFDNLTKEDYNFYDFNKQKNITIKKGSKIIKSFKYFEEDDETLRRLQDEASMLLQQDKITGTLCFSVHPLDFLSISENTYNWRSCHALDGEYRVGNLSYMLDEPTFICYIKGHEKQKLPRFPEEIKWNSKKWRVLLCLDPTEEVMFSGRQYPFDTLEGLKYAKKYLITKQLLPDRHNRSSWFGKWSPWYNDEISGDYQRRNHDFEFLSKHVIIKQKIYKLDDIVEDQSSLHFNDILFSNKYTQPYYCFWTTGNWRSKIKLGAQVPCPICELELLDSHEFLECRSCREEYGIEEDD